MKIIFTGILVLYSVHLLSQNIAIREVDFNWSELLDPAKTEAVFYSAYAANQLRILNLSDSIDVLQQKYGMNKRIPVEIRAAVLCALSYYPEMKSTIIRFRFKSIKGTMNARPALSNLLFKRFDRKYVIILNDDKGKTKGLKYSDLSFNTKIGWFGHEFAHIATYRSMNNWQIIKFSIKYLTSEKFVRKVERYTDFLTISHGLAFAIYDGGLYQKRKNDHSMKYKQYSAGSFLTINEIICFWQSLNASGMSENSK